MNHPFVTIIDRGRLTWWTGVGKSGRIAELGAELFQALGCPAVYASPLDLWHGGLGAITRDDTVIAVSWSGLTVELLQVIDRLDEVPLVAITRRGTPLAAAANIVYEPVGAADLFGLPTSSLVAQLQTTMVLVEAYAAVHPFEPERSHPGGALGGRT